MKDGDYAKALLNLSNYFGLPNTSDAELRQIVNNMKRFLMDEIHDGQDKHWPKDPMFQESIKIILKVN